MSEPASRAPWAPDAPEGRTPQPDARLSSIDRHRRAEALFFEAAARPPEQRAAFLREACGADDRLRDEVESLLAAHDDQGGLLDSAVFASPLAGATSRADAARTEALPHGRRIGAYTVQGTLGSGGMGVVYIAEQERPRRTVALKIIRPGVATPQLLRRFELEAETLGRLHHPGIAQIYEAGTADTGLGPQPYFAMELVRGATLTKHAEAQALGHRERMALIALVCDAAQHAHQRGVIHRDLKPGNILVDEAGQPKILDFGVSRVVSADKRATTMETNIGQLVGTLPYMSPEQVGGAPEDIDTRTDVYSLGVVLYQLLTGRLPHDVEHRSIPEAARIIRDEAPVRLSGVSKVFRGEVDLIVATALEKDKARRYQTAAALADDIRRYLGGEPIAARRDSAFYVLRKQARKHRVAAGAAGVVLTLVLVFAVVSALQAGANRRLASRERSARLEADRAREIAVAEQERASVESERLRQSLYFSSIGYAQAAYASHDQESMRTRLAECPEDLRNWEWDYLSALVDGSDRSTDMNMPDAPVSGAAMLSSEATGATLLTCDLSKIVTTWDTATGERRRDYRMSSTSTYLSATMGPLGDLIYLEMLDAGKLQALAIDTVTGATVWTTTLAPEAIGRLWISADGKLALATGANGAHTLFDARTGEVVRRIGADVWTAMGAISPDGSMIASLSVTGDLRVWDASTGELRALRPGAHAAQGRAVAFSPDSVSIATAGSDGVVRIWDAGSMRELSAIRAHDNKVWCLAWSPDSRLIASAGTDTKIVLTDVATGERIATFQGHRVTVAGLEFTRDGRWLVSSSRDCVVKWWSMPPRPPTPVVDFDYRVLAVAADSAQGRIAVALGTGVLTVLDASNLSEQWAVHAHNDLAFGLAFSPDGALVYSGGADGFVRAWDASTGEPRGERELGPGLIYRLGVAPDGRVAAASQTGGAVIFEPGLTGEQRVIAADTRLVTAIGWSRDCKRLATGGADAVIRLWDTATGEQTGALLGHTSEVYSVAWSPDGSRLYSSGEDWSVRTWDVARGQETGRRGMHGGPVYCLALNPAGDRLVSGSFDNNVKVWDTRSGHDVLTLRGHILSVASVAFGGEGGWIVSGNDDGTVRFWGFARRPAPTR